MTFTYRVRLPVRIDSNFDEVEETVIERALRNACQVGYICLATGSGSKPRISDIVGLPIGPEPLAKLGPRQWEVDLGLTEAYRGAMNLYLRPEGRCLFDPEMVGSNKMYNLQVNGFWLCFGEPCKARPDLTGFGPSILGAMVGTYAAWNLFRKIRDIEQEGLGKMLGKPFEDK